jgi:hypothetical protein
LGIIKESLGDQLTIDPKVKIQKEKKIKIKI